MRIRVLFTTLPLVGHFFPMVSLGWALRCAGAEVLVSTSAQPFADWITGTGLSAIVIDDIPLAEYARASVCIGTGTTLADDLAASGRGWGALGARTLGAMDELVGTFQPDLVISEPAEFSGRIAAARSGTPWVEHSWGLPFGVEFRRAAEAELGQRGLPRLPAPDLVIHPSPRSLWPAGSPDGIAMRYMPYNGPVRLSRWSGREPGRRRAFLTFGSLLVKHGSAEKGELLRKVLEELSAAGFELVVGMDPAQVREFGALPPGVVHAGWVPLAQAVTECNLVIHHGGSGTSFSAAAAGVPQVIVPSMTDQFLTAAILESCGAAMYLRPDQATPTAVLDAATELLTNPCYGVAAATLAGEMASLATPDAIAGQLRKLGLLGLRDGDALQVATT